MDPTRVQPPSLGPGTLTPEDRSPRAAVVASLAEALSRAVAVGDQAPSPLHGPVEARDLLNQLRLTMPRERLVILLADEDEQVSRVARLPKMPTETTFPRLRLDREHLAHVLK